PLVSWFLPAAHVMESWGDACAWDGTCSLIQPLIAPLFGGVSSVEILGALLGEGDRGAYALLREHWQRTFAGPGAFEDFWQTALQRGVIAGERSAPERAAVRWDAIASAAARKPPAPAPRGLELDLHPDAKVRDGRFG